MKSFSQLKKDLQVGVKIKTIITAIDELSNKYVVDEYAEVYDENDEFIGFSEKRTGISCLTEYDLIHHYCIKW